MRQLGRHDSDHSNRVRQRSGSKVCWERARHSNAVEQQESELRRSRNSGRSHEPQRN